MPVVLSSPESSPVAPRRAPTSKNQTNNKKRASLLLSPSSTSEHTPLRPSRSENIPVEEMEKGKGMRVNDDVAEKANRRKSAHFGDLGHGDGPRGPSGPAGSSGGAAAGAPGKRVVSALAVQAGAARKGKRLSTAAPNVPPASLEVMSNNFEEWMKLATDNKITATNTWNFALIDYFADLTLLRNGPDDQSINFQKASCTLDGCVKIWTSRVDSVATETGKLLSGLAGGGGGEEGDGEDGEDEEGAEPGAKKKTYHRSEATLAKSFAALQIKKFDLEFTVDPLFKKTCADFDEGGAMGLLMNHLGIDGKGRVVFDAGDAGVEEEEEEEVDDTVIDLDKLRQFIPSIEQVSTLNISDSLASFKFSSDPASMTDITALLGLKDSWEREDTPRDSPPPSGEVADFFGDENFDVAPGGYGFDDNASMAGDFDGEGESAGYGGGQLGLAGAGEGGLERFDPRRAKGTELVMALVGGGEDGEGMFDYFDKGFSKGWAGAEHWKLKKVSRKVDPAAGASAATAGGKTKAAKAPFTIDFSSPATASTSSKVLFAPASAASLALPGSSTFRPSGSRKSGKKTSHDGARKKREEYLLPDDMHFSSRQLLRLFLKPKFALRMRKHTRSATMAENNGEIDENFWAQAAADRVDNDPAAHSVGGDLPVPFESQFFNDPDDDPDAADYGFVDDALDAPDPVSGGGGEEDDLWAGTQGQTLKRARPENVNFAKKAKRVDVKRLKDDIWTGLRGLVKDVPTATPDASSDEESAAPTPIVTPTATGDASESKTFDSIISSLRTTYPTDKMSEISTSFCFICLLHLANEEGLRIETARYDGMEGEDVGCVGEFDPSSGPIAGEMGDAMKTPSKAGAGGFAMLGKGKKNRGEEGERRDRVVGELQALRVFKDPNAGRAA